MAPAHQPIRLPSFNDFSPEILGHDIRKALEIVRRHEGDRKAAVPEFAKAFFGGKTNKRSSANVPATLTSTKLIDGPTFRLTPFGERVLSASTPLAAAREFVREMLLNRNGLLLIEATRTLYKRRQKGSRKPLLKRELELLGVTELSNATTDHTTLENWFVEAKVIIEDAGFRRPDDQALTALIGVSADEFSQLLALEPGQRLFLQYVRRRQEVEGPSKQLPVSELLDECLRNAPALFREDQFRADVIDPLSVDKWITAAPAKSGKGGWVQAAQKLVRIPLEKILPAFVQGVPADIRGHLSKPLSEIAKRLDDWADTKSSKNNRGLGLELLALRMLFDLGLEPQGFRVRARDTAFAEVDLLAEGRNLLFSRWVVQCKNIAGHVQLSDVAKEVGIAVHKKAHVIAIVTTTEFSPDARNYAKEVTDSTHLQFLLVPGTVVRKYLSAGPAGLVEFVMDNASQVMALKRSQAEPAALTASEPGAEAGSEDGPAEKTPAASGNNAE